MANGDDNFAMGDLASPDPEQLARERAIRFRSNAANMAIQPPEYDQLPLGGPRDPTWAMGALAAQDAYRPLGNDPWTGLMPGQKDLPIGGPDLGKMAMAVGKGIVQDVATPGILAQPNPYPPGSEEADAYEGFRGQAATQWAPSMALNTMGAGGIVGVPVKGAEAMLGMGAVRPRKPAAMGELAAQDVMPPMAGHNLPPTGSFNPLENIPVTFRGKEPKEFTPEDWQAFGEHYGVKNLGPLSPLQTFTDLKGNPFQIPGGLEDTWTYLDALHMKANPINPANVDRALHAEMQKKLGRTMTPAELSDADVWNGLVFGMTSPNNPLFPNQATASRLRLRSPEMLDDLASSIPWKAGDEVPGPVRKAASDQIANRYGLGGFEATGGLGTRGTADYTRIAEMAQLFKKDPNFFRKDPNESWGQAVERISSQLPGLSMKTGSFGTVWQDPAHAAISAIDRHMARELDKRGGIFATPGERTDWENRSVNLWNAREQARQAAELKKTGEINRPANLATDFADLQGKSGADGFMGEMLLDHVGKALTPKFRLATGEINPQIPAHLAQASWVKEPASVFKMGRAYRQALDLNQKLADEAGLNLFMSQWMEWDRIRNRFEPHENMFPGLSKLPAMSIEQMRGVSEAHKATGHKTYGKDIEGALKPTRPMPGLRSQMGYLAVPGVIGAGAMGSILQDDGR